MEVLSSHFTINKEAKTLVAEASDIGGLPGERLIVLSTKTNQRRVFYATSLDEIRDNENELQAINYFSFELPGWTLTIFND